jgi:hypothetical protein
MSVPRRGPNPDSRPDSAGALALAAMRWVAADPGRAAVTATPGAAPPAAARAGREPPAQGAPRVPGEPVRAGDFLPGFARPVPAPAAMAPPAHDELVEISIGTIQVRVDAPSVQTVAPPPAPGPAAAPPASAHTRSALARRALRRI